MSRCNSPRLLVLEGSGKQPLFFRANFKHYHFISLIRWYGYCVSYCMLALGTDNAGTKEGVSVALILEFYPDSLRYFYCRFRVTTVPPPAIQFINNFMFLQVEKTNTGAVWQNHFPDSEQTGDMAVVLRHKSHIFAKSATTAQSVSWLYSGINGIFY